MIPDYLPALGRSLRALAEFAAAHEVTDQTLADVAAELDRARALVASARGALRANSCSRHPDGPVDPTASNGCLLCGDGDRRPAAPIPDGVNLATVLAYAQDHGHQAAADRYGARALARALALTTHPTTRPGNPARPGDHDTDGDNK